MGPTTPHPTEKPWDGRTVEPTATPTFGPTVSGFVCEDTPGWDNFYGMGCDNYEDFRWCTNEGVAEWSLGSNYNFPEENCCICGRERMLMDQINVLSQQKRETEEVFDTCWNSQYDEERIYAEDIHLQKTRIREIQEYIETECFYSNNSSLSLEVRKRIDAIKRYVKIATQNLIRASNLPAQTDLDKIQKTYFEYVLESSRSCDLTGMSSNEIVSLVMTTDYEDCFQACLLFCAYSSDCQAVNYQRSTRKCQLLHSIPSQTNPDSDFECMAKYEESGTSTPTSTLSPGRNLCLCYNSNDLGSGTR